MFDGEPLINAGFKHSRDRDLQMLLIWELREFVSNKAKGRISKRVFQENKERMRIRG